MLRNLAQKTGIKGGFARRPTGRKPPYPTLRGSRAMNHRARGHQLAQVAAPGQRMKCHSVHSEIRGKAFLQSRLEAKPPRRKWAASWWDGDLSEGGTCSSFHQDLLPWAGGICVHSPGRWPLCWGGRRGTGHVWPATVSQGVALCLSKYLLNKWNWGVADAKNVSSHCVKLGKKTYS